MRSSLRPLTRVANAAQLSERTTHRAFSMMKELLRKKTLTAGKDPMGLAASILYIASKETGETKNQRSMASAAGVTEVTIRNRIKALALSSKTVNRYSSALDRFGFAGLIHCLRLCTKH